MRKILMDSVVLFLIFVAVNLNSGSVYAACPDGCVIHSPGGNCLALGNCIITSDTGAKCCCTVGSPSCLVPTNCIGLSKLWNKTCTTKVGNTCPSSTTTTDLGFVKCCCPKMPAPPPIPSGPIIIPHDDDLFPLGPPA